MDCIQIVRNYIEQMIGETGGMKALILDDVTKGIVSQVYSMSEMLEKQTFHLEEIGSEHEKTGYMKAIVFVRPTNENCNKLCEHLKNPLYSEYYLFFSNVVDHDCLRRLAEADEHMLVKGCRESFIDFFAMNPDMFVVGVPHSLRFFQNRERWSPIEKNAFHRSADGLVSFLLAAQKKPFIRHQVGSNLAASLANEVVSKMDREKDLFKTVRQTGMSVLTVVDRREDPITPLMLPWTYQALVHELFTITSNKVTLPDGKDFVLSITQDEFFQEHLFANLGEVMKDVSQLTTQFQNERKATTNGGHSIEELKRLIHNMPKLQEKQHTVSKHVSISTSIGNLMDDVQLMHQSEQKPQNNNNNNNKKNKRKNNKKKKKAVVPVQKGFILVADIPEPGVTIVDDQKDNNNNNNDDNDDDTIQKKKDNASDNNNNSNSKKVADSWLSVKDNKPITTIPIINKNIENIKLSSTKPISSLASPQKFAAYVPPSRRVSPTKSTTQQKTTPTSGQFAWESTSSEPVLSKGDFPTLGNSTATAKRPWGTSASTSRSKWGAKPVSKPIVSTTLEKAKPVLSTNSNILSGSNSTINSLAANNSEKEPVSKTVGWGSKPAWGSTNTKPVVAATKTTQVTPPAIVSPSARLPTLPSRAAISVARENVVQSSRLPYGSTPSNTSEISKQDIFSNDDPVLSKAVPQKKLRGAWGK